MNRCCFLPKTIRSLCEMGCIYRDSTLKHLACPLSSTRACAAPCPEPCACTPKNERFEIVAIKVTKNEVLILQEENTPRIHMRL